MSPLHDYLHRELSLPELVAAAITLGARLPAVGDERVRAEVDDRTVRYYQSSGLVDRPLRYEGRSALYGYRHLLQLLAVKALQGAGYKLAQVQASLAGVPTPELEAAVARALGEVAAAPLPPAPPVAPSPAPRALVQFELAPGLWLTVDPALHPDPAALAAAFTSHHQRKTP